MRAVQMKGFGGPEVLEIGEVPEPEARPDDLIVRVRATALNRADLNQRRGAYGRDSFGDSDIMGLEIAGEVVAWGSNVTGFTTGQRVMGIVGGGAFAQYARLDKGLAIPIPDGFEFTEAAAVPEVFLTANQTAFNLGELTGGQAILVHAAGSGVGTAVVQMAHHVGATVFATAGSAEKLERARRLGADHLINYKSQDFAQVVAELTGGAGVDVVEDFIGADYLAGNLAVLKPGGRLVLVAVMGGRDAEIPLGEVLMRRLQIKGSVMKSRTIEEKRQLNASFCMRWWNLLARRAIRPVIDSVMVLDDIQAAHVRMEANLNCGKIVLTVP